MTCQSLKTAVQTFFNIEKINSILHPLSKNKKEQKVQDETQNASYHIHPMCRPRQSHTFQKFLLPAQAAARGLTAEQASICCSMCGPIPSMSACCCFLKSCLSPCHNCGNFFCRLFRQLCASYSRRLL